MEDAVERSLVEAEAVHRLSPPGGDLVEVEALLLRGAGVVGGDLARRRGVDPERLDGLVDLTAAGAEARDDMLRHPEDGSDAAGDRAVLDPEARRQLVAELGRGDAAGGLRVQEQEAPVEGAWITVRVLGPL